MWLTSMIEYAVVEYSNVVAFYIAILSHLLTKRRGTLSPMWLSGSRLIIA